MKLNILKTAEYLIKKPRRFKFKTEYKFTCLGCGKTWLEYSFYKPQPSFGVYYYAYKLKPYKILSCSTCGSSSHLCK